MVVGGNIAAVRALEELRAKGYSGKIDLVSEEERLPYDRPPLSKGGLVEGDAPIEVLRREWFAENAITLHLGQRATGLDLGRRVVVLDDEALPYDGLVIATGAHPRNPWADHELDGVVTLRTAEDGRALRDILHAVSGVVVIGAGFIGCEVASSARALGCSVTILESAPSPLMRAVGADAGRLLAALHEDHGVDLRCDATVTELGGRGRVEYVGTADGRRIPADAVVVGVGVVPSVEWLAGSGLRLTDGVVCDATLCAGPPGVYAAGDVASWEHPRYGPIRTEQWTTAALQGQRAAANLLAPDGTAEAFTPSPYLWSDQFGSRVQVLGLPSDEPLLRFGCCDDDPTRWAVGWSRHGRLSGVMAFDWPEQIARLRGSVTRGDPIESIDIHV